MKPTVFLDRDGTVIVDTHYPSDPDKVEFLPGAVEGLRALVQKGYTLFVVSNQSGVGRGKIPTDRFHAVDKRFRELLEAERIPLGGIAYCLHAPEEQCGCRKPKTGMLDSVLGEVAVSQSFCVGDKVSDLELARNAALSPVLVLTGQGSRARDQLQSHGLSGVMVCQDLREVGQTLPVA